MSDLVSKVVRDTSRYERAKFVGNAVAIIGFAALLIWIVSNTQDLLTQYHNQTTQSLNSNNVSLNKQLTQARQDLGLEQRQVAGLQAEVQVLEDQLTSLGAKPKVVQVPVPYIVTKPLPAPTAAVPPTTAPPPTGPPPTRPSPTTTAAPCMVPTPSLPTIPPMLGTVPPCLAMNQASPTGRL